MEQDFAKKDEELEVKLFTFSLLSGESAVPILSFYLPREVARH